MCRGETIEWASKEDVHGIDHGEAIMQSTGMATWQEVPSTSSPLLANTSRSMEKATGMETKITGALRTLGAIYAANSISESRKLFSHRRMATCGSFAWTPNSGAWQDTYAMPCHAMPSIPFMKHGNFLSQFALIQRSYDTESQREFLPNHRSSGPALSSE